MSEHFDHMYRDAADLELFWRSLDKRASFTLRCDDDQLCEAIRSAEDCGACGLEFHMHAQSFYLLSGHKGKQGPCYDTGKTAQIQLPQMAALDDDGHLLFETLPVCEKTARIYELDTYRAFVSVSAADPALEKRFVEDPKDFDCDMLGELAQQLRDSFEQQTQKFESEKLIPICYGGPFKLLIGPGGSMLWRAQNCQIPESTYRTLLDLGINIQKPITQLPIQTWTSYKDTYDREGVAGLLTRPLQPVVMQPLRAPQFSAFAACNRSFLKRMRAMLESEQDYIVISGSDPGDPLGCCPSEDVAQAQALVEAGILSCRRQDQAGESCPIALYACNGEFDGQQGASISKDTAFRAHVLKCLKPYTSDLRFFVKTALRFALLACVISGIFIGISSVKDDMRTYEQRMDLESLSAALQIDNDVEVVIALFREQKRCAMCLSMESHARAFKQKYFASDSSVVFRDLNMQHAPIKQMFQEYDLFTSAVVLFTLEDGRIVASETLTEAWEHVDNEALFMHALGERIKSLRVSDD